MLKKIGKQREKIERLAARESDAAEKLAQLRQELAAERDALDEMEKEHLFNLMRERALSLEETIALMEKRAEEMPETLENGSVPQGADANMPEFAEAEQEPEDQEITPVDETDAAAEDIFTEDAALFEGELEKLTSTGDSTEDDAEDAESVGSFFKGFRSKADENDNGFWQ